MTKSATEMRQAAAIGSEAIDFVQSTLRTDPVPPVKTLLHASKDDSLQLTHIPKERYYTREYHDLEVERVWKKVWQMACWEHDIPEPGDVYLYKLADISIIIVRQHDRSLKAFYNSCLHRGRQLVDTNCRVPALRCPYHGFTWSLNGAIRHIPCREEFPHIQEASFGLPQVRVETWNGFAFITLDPNAPPLHEYLEDVPEQFKEWDFSNRFKSAHVEKIVPVNWKLMLEAFIEAFHVPSTHNQLVDFSGDAQGQYDVYPGRKHFTRGITLTGFVSGQYPNRKPSEQTIVDNYVRQFYPDLLGTEIATVPPGGSARVVLSNISRLGLGRMFNVDLSKVSTADTIDGIWYHIFPNFMPWPTYGYPLVYRFRPFGNDPDQSIMDIMILSPFEGERPPSAPVVRQTMSDRLESLLGGLGAILDQDVDNISGLQAGVKAAAVPAFPVALYQESRIRRFHQTLDEYISKA